MSALHLPAPHRCPACGGPHQELPRADEVRPYFGTFLQIAGSGGTPTTASQALSVSSTGAAVNSQSLTLSSPIGFWVVVATLATGVGSSADSFATFQLVVGGVGQTPQSCDLSNSVASPFPGCSWGYVWSGIVGGSTAFLVTVSGWHINNTFTGSLAAWFAPTPTYRR